MATGVTLSYACQGNQKTLLATFTGDTVSFDHTLAFGATWVSGVGMIPANCTGILIDSDIDCTVDCGSNDPITITAGIPYLWILNDGRACPFAGSSSTSFTIVSTEGSGSGEVRVFFGVPT